LKLDFHRGVIAADNAGIKPVLSCVKKIAFLSGIALLLAGCRLDMHVQPKYLPYNPSKFFDDGRSERPVVPGTVARGQLRLDELLYTGKENGTVADKFPFPITRADIERGRERYSIYCTPCHDYAGSGQGMIVQRGFPPPPSFHTSELRQAPAGHFFEVITNGYGSMYSYAARVEPGDRWRIAAYIRVLQLSQHATMQDVPESERGKLTEGNAAKAPGQP
jgi:Cytochrome C oxidase, cbb3-type, subunit III